MASASACQQRGARSTINICVNKTTKDDKVPIKAGDVRLQLPTATNGNGNGFGGPSSSSSLGPGFDVQRATQLRMIHGILASVAFVGLFPIGAVLVRVVPGPLAWVVHALTQTLAYVMFVAAAVLGLYLVSMVKIPPNGASLVSFSSLGVLLTPYLHLSSKTPLYSRTDQERNTCCPCQGHLYSSR